MIVKVASAGVDFSFALRAGIELIAALKGSLISISLMFSLNLRFFNG